MDKRKLGKRFLVEREGGMVETWGERKRGILKWKINYAWTRPSYSIIFSNSYKIRVIL